MQNHVYVLELVTKNDLEDTEHLKGKVFSQMKGTNRWCKPGFHAKRLIKFVITTPESKEQLYESLSAFLRDLLDLGSIERFALLPAPEWVITDHGQLDAFSLYLAQGRVEAADRNKSQRLRNLERRKRRF